MEETCSPGKKGMKITEVKPVKKKKECNNVGQKAYDIQCKTPEQRKSPKCKKSPCHKPDTNKPKPCNDFKARECEKESAGRCKLETKKAAQKRTGKTPKKLNMNDRKCEKAATSGGYKNKSLKRKKRRKRKGKHKSLKKRK